LAKINKEDVKFYSRILANHFFRRNVQLRRITDESERNRQKLLIETESEIFSLATKNTCIINKGVKSIKESHHLLHHLCRILAENN